MQKVSHDRDTSEGPPVLCKHYCRYSEFRVQKNGELSVVSQNGPRAVVYELYMVGQLRYLLNHCVNLY